MESTQQEPVISAALARVGYLTAAERLDALTREIIDASPADRAAIHERFVAAVRDEADLLWALISEREHIIGDHIGRVFAAMRRERQNGTATGSIGVVTKVQRQPDHRPALQTGTATGSTRLLTKVQSAHDPVRRPALQTGGGAVQRNGDYLRRGDRAAVTPSERRAVHTCSDRPAVLDRSAPPRQQQPVRGIEAIRLAAEPIRRMLLDTFKVNERPIGDVDATEAGKWAGSRERDGRFVRLLIEGLPPTGRIRDYRTPEDADTLYALAEKASNA